MAQYYTLEEAAAKLGLTTDAFRRRLATEWKSTPRRYPDGATLRFQVREIDELARSFGGSSGELEAGDAPLSLADSSEDFVPLKGDSGVKLGGKSGKLPKSAADSDVRLEQHGGSVKPASSGKLKKKQAGDRPTEEIDLDAEHAARGPKSPVRPTGKYEVSSDPDVQIKPPTKDADSGSEFELSLAPDSSDEFDLKLTDDDSDEVEIGTMPRGVRPGDSGINLQSPADSGISLEKASSSEFELQLQGDQGKTGSKPKKPSTDKLPPAAKAAAADDSDSEFELTLDDSGEAAVTDATTAYSDEQKDIFETDFELPALDDESGSEAVALESDTDVESSDFDLAIGEDDAAADEASESEVVAIDEDEPRPARRRRAADDDDLDELEAAEDVDLEAEDEPRPSRAVAPAAAAAPATWGSLPAIVLLPTVFVMALVGLMGFELLHSMWGYQQPYKPTGGLVRLIAETFGDKLPVD